MMYILQTGAANTQKYLLLLLEIFKMSKIRPWEGGILEVLMIAIPQPNITILLVLPRITS